MKILEDKGYKFIRHLSTGGEGEIYLIKSVDKQFIAKVYPTLSNESVAVLKTIQGLHIEGIPEIHEIFSENGKTFIIRDYVEGTTLYDEIRKNECLSLQQATKIILSICHTLRQLHNAGPNPIVYRDLKPENIIVTPDGGIRLIDFGIARYYNPEKIRDTVLAGTKGYTAPEVMAGIQSDQRSDVYSAGLLFYEMLTGKNLHMAPFQVRPVRESSEYLPDWLDDVIQKATDINQTKRYRTMEAFITAIETTARQQRKRKMRIMLWIAAGIVLAAAGALVFTLASNGGEPVGVPAAGTAQTQGGYEVLLDLEFDEFSDFNWLYLIRDPQFHDDDEGSFPELAHDGLFDMAYEFGMKYPFKTGDIYHIRIKPGASEAEGMLLLLCFAPHIDKTFHEDSYELLFNNKQPFVGELRTDDSSWDQTASGSPMLVSNRWYDVIVCLDTGNTFRYFVFESENSEKAVYGGAAALDRWDGLLYEIYVDLYFEHWQANNEILPFSQVDLIRHCAGSVAAYLADNIHGYQQHKDEIDAFLGSEFKSVSE